MQSYTHFTQNERYLLHEYLNKNFSLRHIADLLGRNVSTISREIKRNRSKQPKQKSLNKYNYHFWRAHILSVTRRRKKLCKALPEGSSIKDYVVEKLKQFWSPEQIVNRRKIINKDSPVSVSTIYRYIKRGMLGNITAKTNLRRRGKNYRRAHISRQVIYPDRLIPEWPESIKERCRIGDWEGDTVYGGIGKGCLVTLVDRKSRYLCADKIITRNGSETRECISRLLKYLPVTSISLDNGTEFAEFRQLETELKTLIYFAEPHKPWQRGTNENTNDILRFFFPKGFDFRYVDSSYIQTIVDLINNRPRKCLGWLTPNEVFNNVALT